MTAFGPVHWKGIWSTWPVSYTHLTPTTVIMEAPAADCLYQGAKAADGKIRFVDGDLQTIMAGLACGEPNTISWDILKNHSSFFVSCPDWVSAKGMRMLGAPVKGLSLIHI